MAASEENLKQIKSIMTIQTIGYNKINMMRHVKYFGDAEGIRKHMKLHASIIRPKFEIVLNTFDENLSGLGIADWTRPKGGYFISLNVLPGTAKRVYELCKTAGLTLTTVARHLPLRHRPKQHDLRIAPTFPTNEDLKTACSCSLPLREARGGREACLPNKFHKKIVPRGARTARDFCYSASQ